MTCVPRSSFDLMCLALARDARIADDSRDARGALLCVVRGALVSDARGALLRDACGAAVRGANVLERVR